jgi:hypothetical protein
MKHVGAFVLMALSLGGALSLSAAQPTNESFTAGANGWVGSAQSPFGTFAFWSFTGGAARVLFTNPGFAIPENATLSNAPAASGGAFTGNYEQAGINLIGFSVLAPQVVPSGFVILEWSGSTSLYQRGFTMTATGVWHRFTASLADTERDRWTTLQGSIDDFAAARQSVSRVTIRISRNGLPDHQFVIDDLYLVGEPEARALEAGAGDTLTTRWQALNAGVSYQVQSAPAVTGVWAAAQSFVATGAVQSITLTNSGPTRFWRTVRP